MTEGYVPFTQCTKQAKTNDRAFKQIQGRVRAKSPQLCLTLCDPSDYSPSGSGHEILQARILEWVVMPSSRGSSQPRD